MPRNVEIKAWVRDMDALRERLESLSDTVREAFEQEDTFFVTPCGRLKLRVLSTHSCELIYYERPDEASAKTSTYEIIRSDDPMAFSRILRSVLPVRGVVTKRRHLFRIGQTRVHLDSVDDLGEFIELEVVLSDGQSTDEGCRIAAALMDQLEVRQDDLVAGAYIDLLEEAR